jgi:hypothetical protein
LEVVFLRKVPVFAAAFLRSRRLHRQRFCRAHILYAHLVFTALRPSRKEEYGMGSIAELLKNDW